MTSLASLADATRTTPAFNGRFRATMATIRRTARAGACPKFSARHRTIRARTLREVEPMARDLIAVTGGDISVYARNTEFTGE